MSRPIADTVYSSTQRASRMEKTLQAQTGNEEVHDQIPELFVGGIGVALVQEHRNQVGAERFGFGAARGLECAPFGPDDFPGEVVQYLVIEREGGSGPTLIALSLHTIHTCMRHNLYLATGAKLLAGLREQLGYHKNRILSSGLN